MDPQIRLELAQPVDARQIASMSRTLIEYGLPWRWRPESILRLLRDPDTSVLAAHKSQQRERRIGGFAIMSFDWNRGTSHLILLAVAPALQRKGLGRALVRWLEVVARRGGIRRVELEVRATSHAALGFYRSLGYAEAGRISGYYQGREDAVKMVSPLESCAYGPS